MQEEKKYDDKHIKAMSDAELEIERKRIDEERRRRGLHTEEKKQ